MSSLLNMLNYGQPATAGSYQLGGQPVSDPAQFTNTIAQTQSSPAHQSPDFFSMGSIFGSRDAQGNYTNGWGSTALGLAQGLGSAYMGMKQYGLAQDTLKEQRRQFDMNYQAQRQTLNTQLEDRQRARVAANPGAYESVGTYMNRHGV